MLRTGAAVEAVMEAMETAQERPGAVVARLFGDPLQGAALFTQAYKLDENPENWVLARNLYREVVRLLPLHIAAWNNLGVTARKLGDRAEALWAWGQALVIDSKFAEAHNNIGTLFQDEKKYENAAVYLLRAVKFDPDMDEARINLALCLQALGRRKAALKHWRWYLEHRPAGEWEKLAAKHAKLCSA